MGRPWTKAEEKKMVDNFTEAAESRMSLRGFQHMLASVGVNRSFGAIDFKIRKDYRPTDAKGIAYLKRLNKAANRDWNKRNAASGRQHVVRQQPEISLTTDTDASEPQDMPEAGYSGGRVETVTYKPDNVNEAYSAAAGASRLERSIRHVIAGVDLVLYTREEAYDMIVSLLT